MTSIPDFITHYHRSDRQPFLNLSDLDPDALSAVLSDLESPSSTCGSHRRFGPRYMALRRATEVRLRERFIERGGRPSRPSPHYFVLGESEWFRGLYDDPAEVRLQISDLPTAEVSFTIPDSTVAMGLLAEFGIDLPVRPHHGHVYRIDELEDAIDAYGWPNSPEPASYEGHQSADFEHFIEVQVWTDDPLDRRET